LFSLIVVKVDKVLLPLFGQPFSLIKKLKIDNVVFDVFLGLIACGFIFKKRLNPFVVHDKLSDPWMINVFC
jgi:hypothetical protein